MSLGYCLSLLNHPDAASPAINKSHWRRACLRDSLSCKRNPSHHSHSSVTLTMIVSKQANKNKACIIVNGITSFIARQIFYDGVNIFDSM